MWPLKKPCRSRRPMLSPFWPRHTSVLSCKFIEEFVVWGGPPGRCELIEAVRAANGSRKKLRVCRPYKQSVGPRDTLHIPGICALFSESRLVHIFQGVCPTISVQFPAFGKLRGIEHECLRHDTNPPSRQ